jgi:hypothetical protein
MSFRLRMRPQLNGGTLGGRRDERTLSDPSVVFVAGASEWGFFTGEQSTRPSIPIDGLPDDVRQDLLFVHIPGLETTLSFCRVRLDPVLGGAPTDIVVVSAYAPFPPDSIPDATRMLLPASSPAGLCLIVEGETGWARATSVTSIPPEAVAAAVAHSKIVGGWDETNPIVITVQGDAFQVSGRFENATWKLAVARAW